MADEDTMMDVKVGNEVVVTGKYVRSGRYPITKVGRVYFYVDDGDTPFQRSDGREKPDKWGDTYKARAWRPEDYEADQVRNEVLAKLREHGVSWVNNWTGNKMVLKASNFTTARLFEFLAFLDSVADEVDPKNLDT